MEDTDQSHRKRTMVCVALCIVIVLLLVMLWRCATPESYIVGLDKLMCGPPYSAYGRYSDPQHACKLTMGVTTEPYVNYKSPALSKSNLFGSDQKENFGVCQDCDTTIPDREIPSGGFSTINPFIYPYSGAECLDEIQSIVSTHVPLTHATAPDHVVLTN